MIFSIIIIFCAGEIQCKDYGINPRDKGRLTNKGRECIFPFSYQGVVYKDCAPGISQPSPWCATSTKDDFSNTVMDWEICASVTRVDKFCKSLDYDDCKSEAIKRRCHQMCSTGVDEKFCKSLDYDDCKSEAIKRRCPQMCSAGVDKFCKSLDYDDCKSEAIKRRCPQMCSTGVDEKFCKSLDYDDCKSEDIKRRCPQMCSAGVDDKSCKSLDYDNCKSEAIKKRCPQMCSADFCIVAEGTKVAGQCLFFSDDSKTRADSIKSCEAKGQQLASLLDPIDFNAYMKSNYGPFEAFWLGGTDWRNEGRWVWIDGRPFENFPWELGQPDDNQNYGGQDCLAWGWNSEFDDKNCFKENRYICELKYPWRSDNRCGTSYLAPNGQAAICNGGCCSPGGWCGDTSDHCDCSACVDYRGSKEPHCVWPYERRGDECFFVSEDGIELLNWDESRQKCLDMDGDLAMPHDMVDFVEYIKESYPDSKPSTIWLGATDEAVEQEWKWVSGESVPAEMWKPWPGRQPSGDGNCLEIHYHPNTDYYMNDWYCNKKGLYACEFELSGK